MIIDRQKAATPLRKLRKLLKDWRPNGRPEDVHRLRTETRKFEATVHALSPEFGGEWRRALKLIKPVLKSAGKVRDTDVLIAKASSLSQQKYANALLRLIEHLASKREKRVKKLGRTLDRHGRKARIRLKRCLRSLQNEKHEAETITIGSTPAKILVNKLERWPNLRRDNLHDFRKRLKELRYMLQLVPGDNEHLLSATAEVKDATGDWHDWVELKCVAESVLDADEDSAVLAEIRILLREKLRVALLAANTMRQKRFGTAAQVRMT